MSGARRRAPVARGGTSLSASRAKRAATRFRLSTEAPRAQAIRKTALSSLRFGPRPTHGRTSLPSAKLRRLADDEILELGPLNWSYIAHEALGTPGKPRRPIVIGYTALELRAAEIAPIHCSERLGVVAVIMTGNRTGHSVAPRLPRTSGWYSILFSAICNLSNILHEQIDCNRDHEQAETLA